MPCPVALEKPGDEGVRGFNSALFSGPEVGQWPGSGCVHQANCNKLRPNSCAQARRGRETAYLLRPTGGSRRGFRGQDARFRRCNSDTGIPDAGQRRKRAGGRRGPVCAVLCPGCRLRAANQWQPLVPPAVDALPSILPGSLSGLTHYLDDDHGKPLRAVSPEHDPAADVARSRRT